MLEVVALFDQIYETSDVAFALIVVVIAPFLLPLQVSFNGMPVNVIALTAIEVVPVAIHPLASVTVTE